MLPMSYIAQDGDASDMSTDKDSEGAGKGTIVDSEGTDKGTDMGGEGTEKGSDKGSEGANKRNLSSVKDCSSLLVPKHLRKLVLERTGKSVPKGGTCSTVTQNTCLCDVGRAQTSTPQH